jgi:hypothetical protein
LTYEMRSERVLTGTCASKSAELVRTSTCENREHVVRASRYRCNLPSMCGCQP